MNNQTLENDQQTQQQSRQKLTVIGCVTFNKQFTPKIYQQLEIKFHNHTITKQYWWIDHKIYQRQKWPQIIPFIQQSKCEYLITYNIPTDLTIQILSVPFYTKLTVLSIQNCKIKNLELLSYLNIENIQRVAIQYNEVCTAKSLNKTNWKQLQRISFHRNRLAEVSMERMKLSQKGDTIVVIEEGTQDNLSGFAKIQMNHVNYIMKGNFTYMMRQHQAIQSLKRKFINGEIQVAQPPKQQ